MSESFELLESAEASSVGCVKMICYMTGINYEYDWWVDIKIISSYLSRSTKGPGPKPFGTSLRSGLRYPGQGKGTSLFVMQYIAGPIACCIRYSLSDKMIQVGTCYRGQNKIAFYGNADSELLRPIYRP
jgi:hypothetical protein